MNRQQFLAQQLEAMPDDISLMEASDYIRAALRASDAYPRPEPAPRMWMRNRDGERACSTCRGFGEISEDTGFSAGVAVIECPTCRGTGSPFIATVRRSSVVPAGFINRMGY